MLSKSTYEVKVRMEWDMPTGQAADWLTMTIRVEARTKLKAALLALSQAAEGVCTGWDRLAITAIARV